MTEERVYYVTQYALTRGILKVKGTVSEHGYLYYKEGSDASFRIPPQEHFLVLEDALQRYQDLVRRKQLSLRKQLEKLDRLARKEPEVIEV